MNSLHRRVVRLADHRAKHPTRVEDLSDDELLRRIAEGAPNPVEFAALLKAMTDEQFDVIFKRIEAGLTPWT